MLPPSPFPLRLGPKCKSRRASQFNSLFTVLCFPAATPRIPPSFQRGISWQIISATDADAFSRKPAWSSFTSNFLPYVMLLRNARHGCFLLSHRPSLLQDTFFRRQGPRRATYMSSPCPCTRPAYTKPEHAGLRRGCAQFSRVLFFDPLINSNSHCSHRSSEAWSAGDRRL